ncbi:hypothetical protein V8G54_002324 [Vigna mungo]|uniref:Uncharacterized protein n=1 Tax=Vigna mungo TaxID=3915 RepID=A0AAQ3PAC4_VIGMU
MIPLQIFTSLPRLRAYKITSPRLKFLANHIFDYPPNFYLSCFLSCLKSSLCHEVTAFQPPNLPYVIALAKPHKNKFHSSLPPPNRFGHAPIPPLPLTTTPSTQPKPLPPLLPAPTTKLPIKRLFDAKMQAHREKNLCFNCDERYTRGHRCKPHFLLLTTFDTDNQEDCFSSDDSVAVEDTSQEAGLISLYAFSGQWTPITFQVIGFIQVIGVHCLSLISMFAMDYNDPFMRVEALFQLTMDSHPLPFSPIITTSSPWSSPLPSSTEPTLQSLISQYHTLFSILTAVPPPHPTDHSITLNPNTLPISMRPYRFPYFQK